MLPDILIVLLTVAALVGLGYLFSEVAFRIEYALVKRQARRHAHTEYVIFGPEGQRVEAYRNAGVALQHFIGLLDHTLVKYEPGQPPVMVGRNRTMKSEKKAV